MSGDRSQPGQGGEDYWLVSIDNDGNKLWDKGFGGRGQEKLYSMGGAAAGEFYIAGHSTSGISGDKSQASKGGSDFWMLKINSLGDKIWDRGFGGNKNEELRSVIRTTDGGALLGGKSFSGVSGDKTEQSRGSSDYWVIKVDNNGVKQWDKRLGGSGPEELRYLMQIGINDYLLGGRSESGISGDIVQPAQGGLDYWIVELSDKARITSMASATAAINETVEAQGSLLASSSPFSDKVTVSFELLQSQQVSLKVYSSQGAEVATLYQGEAQAGKAYEVDWQPDAQFAAGMYIIRIQAGRSNINPQKVILIR